MDQLPRLGKRELICLLLFTCNYVVSVWRGFLLLWVLGMGYVILLWYSLSLPLIIIHQYGIRGDTLNWIKDFLGNRKQTVVINGINSDEVPVSSGDPQGSVLGPILFLAYINDLPEQVKSRVRLRR